MRAKISADVLGSSVTSGFSSFTGAKDSTGVEELEVGVDVKFVDTGVGLLETIRRGGGGKSMALFVSFLLGGGEEATGSFCFHEVIIGASKSSSSLSVSASCFICAGRRDRKSVV